MRDAGTADSNSIKRLVNTDNSVTAGAGRQRDAGDSGGMQTFDKPRDHPQWCSMPVSGEQRGIGLDSPRQPLLIRALATGLVDHRGDRVFADQGIKLGDNGVDHRDRITVIDVTALSASWLSAAVEGFHTFDFPAAGAARSAVFARAAIPILTFAGEGPQMLAACGAARR
jgi:hypothetical protein